MFLCFWANCRLCTILSILSKVTVLELQKYFSGALAKEGKIDETPAALDDLKNEFVKIQMWVKKSDLDI